jgi:hypothetical protein
MWLPDSMGTQTLDDPGGMISTEVGCSFYVLIIMAAANASAGQRAAILASPLSELTGFNLTVDCLSPGCARERTFAVTDLASFYGGSRTVGEVLRRMRCSGACGGRVGAAWLVTGPVLNAHVRPRRVALWGLMRVSDAHRSSHARGTSRHRPQLIATRLAGGGGRTVVETVGMTVAGSFAVAIRRTVA